MMTQALMPKEEMDQQVMMVERIILVLTLVILLPTLGLVIQDLIPVLLVHYVPLRIYMLYFYI